MKKFNHQRASLHKEAAQPLRKQINEIKKTEQNYVSRLFGFAKKELSEQASQRIQELEQEIEGRISGSGLAYWFFPFPQFRGISYIFSPFLVLLRFTSGIFNFSQKYIEFLETSQEN